MTTSPSWFDKQKFSALVKQVGPKRSPETVARDKRRAAPEQAIEMPATALVLPTNPALEIPPAAPVPLAPESTPAASSETEPKLSLPPAESGSATTPAQSTGTPEPSNDLAEAQATIEQLTKERQVARGEVSIVRGQMAQMEEAVKDRETLAMQLLETLQALEERNELQANYDALQAKHTELRARSDELQLRRDELQTRHNDLQLRYDELQLRQDELRAKYAELQPRLDELVEKSTEQPRLLNQLSEQAAARQQAEDEAARLRDRLVEIETAATRKVGELVHTNQELVDSNENLQGQLYRVMQETARLVELPQLEEESHRLRDSLQRREAELLDLRQAQSGSLEIIDSLKFELNRLNEEAAAERAQAEAAQQGLIASQKTLQETREALREVSQNSANKGMLENLQRECSTLVQQNMLLQAQLDQLQRELSAAKAKAASQRG